MQRLGRTAASVLQLQRFVTAASVQQAGGAQCEWLEKQQQQVQAAAELVG